MRFYTLQLDRHEEDNMAGELMPVKTEYKTKEERNAAAPKQLEDLAKKWDVSVVLKIDVDQNGDIFTETLEEYHP